MSEGNDHMVQNVSVLQGYGCSYGATTKWTTIRLPWLIIMMAVDDYDV